jgi:transposase-like protein
MKNCPECGSSNTYKIGRIRFRTGWYQRYRCKDCGRTFVAEKID